VSEPPFERATLAEDTRLAITRPHRRRCVINSRGNHEVAYPDGAGWLLFAGTILGIAGVMRIFDAFWAFRYDGALPDQLEGAILGTSLSTYGWVFLIVGVILIVSSVAVLNRSQLARWIGIFAGSMLAVTAFWWMPFYPVWSLAYVLIGVLVVYGLAAHGGRVAA
jgi:hypothetical protein